MLCSHVPCKPSQTQSWEGALVLQDLGWEDFAAADTDSQTKRCHWVSGELLIWGKASKIIKPNHHSYFSVCIVPLTVAFCSGHGGQELLSFH